MVQRAGHGYRLKAELLKQEFNCAGLIRYSRGQIEVLDPADWKRRYADAIRWSKRNPTACLRTSPAAPLSPPLASPVSRLNSAGGDRGHVVSAQ